MLKDGSHVCVAASECVLSEICALLRPNAVRGTAIYYDHAENNHVLPSLTYFSSHHSFSESNVEIADDVTRYMLCRLTLLCTHLMTVVALSRENVHICLLCCKVL